MIWAGSTLQCDGACPLGAGPFGGAGLVSDSNGFIPADAEYRVRCWFDRNDNDKVDDGDWLGHAVGEGAPVFVNLFRTFDDEGGAP